MSALSRRSDIEAPRKGAFVPHFVEDPGPASLPSNGSGTAKTSDSGIFLLPDGLTQEESNQLDALIRSDFQTLIIEVAGDIGRVILGSESTISLNMPYTRSNHGKVSTMIPDLYYLKGDVVGATHVGPIKLEDFLEYVVSDVFEVDGREISTDSLREAIRWTIKTLFPDLEIMDDQNSLSREQLLTVEKRVNSPELQLANATLLRTILKVVDAVESQSGANETGEKIKAVIGEGEKTIHIPRKRREAAIIGALYNKCRTEAKKGANKNLIYEYLMHQENFEISLNEESTLMASFDELMSIYIKLSHILSHLALKDLPKEYIEDIALAGLESLTEGVKLPVGQSFGAEQAFTIIANLVNPSDPTWSAVIRYFAHKKEKQANS